MDDFMQRQEECCETLAKNNINILNVNDEYILYEYQFRMKNGQTKWTKTVHERRAYETPLCDELYEIIEIVRRIRLGVE